MACEGVALSELVNAGLAGRRRWSLSGAFVAAVVQDFSNGRRVGDEGDDLHLGSAVRAG